MKKLNLKNFEKAKDIYENILDIDNQILLINEIADKIIENDCTTDVCFNIIGCATDENKSDMTDSFDAEISGSGILSFLMKKSIMEPNISKNKTTLSFSNDECLLLLSGILAIKNKSKDMLIKELNNLGVK